MDSITRIPKRVTMVLDQKMLHCRQEKADDLLMNREENALGR